MISATKSVDITVTKQLFRSIVMRGQRVRDVKVKIIALHNQNTTK